VNDSETRGKLSSLAEVTTSVPSIEVAEAISKQLVEAHLVACAQVSGPMRSIYRWQNAIEESQEWKVVLKTIPTKVDPLLARLRELHPYQVPELSVSITDWVDPRFLAWVDEETTPPSLP
jgi:periplasmic divalent cation tolerance protein